MAGDAAYYTPRGVQVRTCAPCIFRCETAGKLPGLVSFPRIKNCPGVNMQNVKRRTATFKLRLHDERRGFYTRTVDGIISIQSSFLDHTEPQIMPGGVASAGAINAEFNPRTSLALLRLSS